MTEWNDKNKEQLKASAGEWYDKNKEQKKASMTEWNDKNKEQLKASARERYQKQTKLFLDNSKKLLKLKKIHWTVRILSSLPAPENSR